MLLVLMRGRGLHDMAKFQVSPAEKFAFKTGKWSKWIKQFERFHIASGLEMQAELNQVDALIYTMGEEAEYILVFLYCNA